MTIKTRYIYYQAKNNTAGLTDVTANVFLNAVGADTPVAANIPLVEVSSATAPGVYALELAAADLTAFGGAGTYSIHINSASRSAPAVAKIQVFENDNDDIFAKLVAIEVKVDAIQADLDLVQTDVTSIKATVEDTNSVINDPDVGNANIKALIESVVSAVNSVQNNTRFIAVIPSQLVVPETGLKRYVVEMRLYDTEGNLEDPDTNQIQVSITNEAGIDRTNYIVGFTAGAVDATRNSEGNYTIALDIPDTAAIEQLVLDFDFTENSVPVNFPRTTRTIEDVAASGTALQTTLLEVLTDTADIQPRVENIEAIVADATFGNAALKALIDIVDGVVDANNAELISTDHGLAALKVILDAKASQVSVDALLTILQGDIKGAGFDNASDSLKAISDRSFTGGRAF